MAISDSPQPIARWDGRRRGVFHGWYILAANCLVMGFSSGVTNYGATVFFNPVSHALGISRTVASLAIALARAENTVLAPIVGYFIDRFGPRPPIITGMFLMGLGMICFGLFARNLLLFVVTWTFMVSLGANIGGFAPNWAAINNWFNRKKGRAMGIGMASQAMGGVILAPMLAFIISRWGWETGAVVTGIAIFVLVMPVTKLIRTRPQDMGLLPDGDPPEPSAASTAMLDARQADGKPHALVEMPGRNFTIKQAFKAHAFWLFMGALALRQMAQAGMVLHMSPMLQDRYGFTGVEAGVLVGILAAMGVVGALSGGYISDLFQRRKVMGIIVGLEAVSLFLLLLNELPLVYVFIVIFGFGQGAHALNRAILGEYFGNSHYARLWGMLSMGTTPFAASGPVVAGWISDTSGYGAAIFVFMLLYGVSGLLYYNCRRPPIPVTSTAPRPSDS
ncbi:MAG: MFS transporter [Chloroflexi bacterium]|nr:MFS transporter [Chloroflexota bacterium]